MGGRHFGPCHTEQLRERSVHMQSKLDEMLEQAVRPSAFEDALVGVGTVVVALAIGWEFAVPEILRELVVGEDGAFVIGAVLVVMAIFLGGLLSTLHALRRLSREVNTSERLGWPGRAGHGGQ
jgi:hypothetical protein